MKGLTFYVSGNKTSMSHIQDGNGDAIALVNHMRGIIEATPTPAPQKVLPARFACGCR